MRVQLVGSRTGIGRGWVTVVALAVCVALLPAQTAGARAGSASAPAARAGATASCPAAPFTDRSEIPEAHRSNVDCAYAEGIAQGARSGAFRPAPPVRRDQVVSFVDRTLRAGGFADRLPRAARHRFGDLRGNVHADAIATMAAIGVVNGTSPTTFSPAATVTRAQLASFVLRAFAWAHGRDVARFQSDRDRFDDVDTRDVHRRNINGAADRGLVRGVTADRFSPGTSARRDQTVTMLLRLLVALPDPAGGSDDGGDDGGGTDDGSDDDGTDDDGTDDGGTDDGSDDGGSDDGSDGGGGDAPTFPADAAVHGIEVRADAVRLSWSPAADPAAVERYEVELVGGGPAVQAAVLDDPVVATTAGRSVEVDGLQPGTTYSFRVRAVGPDGQRSPDGPTITVTTIDTGPPLDLDLEFPSDRGATNHSVDPTQHAAHAVTYTSSGGIQYHLTIPQGALLGPEVIVMTPIVAADGLPGDGRFVAGVKLEPEGLLLREPANLRIVLPEDADVPPPGQEVPMAFDGDGEAVHLAAFDPPGRPNSDPPHGDHGAYYDVQVDHFSGIVISEGGAAERADVLARAGDRRAQLAGRIADGIASERAAALAGEAGDPDWPAQHEALLREARAEVVEPLLRAAETDDALAQEAVSAALAWLRAMELLGLATEADQDGISTAVELILRNAYETSRARCFANADVREAVTMLGLLRSLELLGVPSYPWSDVEACLGQEFEVGFSASSWHRNTSEISDNILEASGSLAATVRVVREPGPVEPGTPVRFVGQAVPTASDIDLTPQPNVCNVRDVALEEDANVPVVVEPAVNPRRDAPAQLLLRFAPIEHLGPGLNTRLEFRAGHTSEDGCVSSDHLRSTYFVGMDLGWSFGDLAFRVPIDGSISRSGSRMQPCPPLCYRAQASMELSLTRIS